MTSKNVKAGQAGTITFIQDGTGGRTAVFNSIFKFSGGTTPSLIQPQTRLTSFPIPVRSATFCVASLLQNVR